MNFVAFDIETAREAPEDKDGDYDLGVTCAAACVVENGDKATVIWHGAEWFGRYGDRMTQHEVDRFVDWLWKCAATSFRLVSWNGLGFDFRVLHEAVQADKRGIVRNRALASVDPFFQMVCEKGYGIGLATAAKGMRLGGKTEGMDGLRAVEMWQGDRRDQEKVLEYVARDAEMTADVYQTIIAPCHVRWTSRSGRVNTWSPTLKAGPRGYRMLTVREACEISKPDTSWMDAPWRREDFYGWTGREPGEEA